AVVLSLAGGAAAFYVKYFDAKEQEEIARARATDLEAALGQRDKALAKAQEEKRRADEGEEHALHLLDNSQVQFAQTALDSGVAGVAAERLQAVRPAQRAWEWHYLRRRVEGGIFTLYGHTSALAEACFSPDGSRLATASYDRTARIWDARTGQQLLDL